MKQRRICHLTSVHSYDDDRIFLKECRASAAGGFETHFVASNAPDGIKDGVHLHGLPSLGAGRRRRMTQGVWRVYQQAGALNADLYHFHDPELLPVGLLLKLQGKRVIYDVHEDYPQAILDKQWLPGNCRPLVAQVTAKLEELIARKMDMAVVVTPHIRDRFVNMGCRARIIHNYPLLNEFYFPELDWGKKERAVCFAGGITESRGLIEMVAAIGLTDGKLLLAGRFESASDRKKAGNLTGWLGVEEFGQINRQRVGQIYGTSMAGLVLYHPAGNHVSALPAKIFEYMAAGIPAICSNFPLWQEIISENQCGICVDPLNPREIAAAIRYLFDHPEEAQRMGENGRRAVLEKYNWEAESKKLIKIYETIFNHHQD